MTTQYDTRTTVPDTLAALETELDEWMNQNADRFDPLAWDELPARALRRKAFAEASLFLHVVDSVGDGTAVPALRELVVDRANDPTFHALLRRYPEEALKFGYSLAYADAHDALDDPGRTALQETLEHPAVFANERPAFRVCDSWHLCQMCGRTDLGPALEQVFDLSCLRFPLDPIRSEEIDGYALTHHVLFYRNFGADGPNFPEGRLPYDLRDILTTLVLRYMASNNTDLVLELVFVGVLQRDLPSDLAATALNWVLAQSEDVPYLVGPEMDEGTIPGMHRGDENVTIDDFETWDDEDLQWAQNYHTTLVGGMVTRVLRREWDDFVAEAPETGIDHDAHWDDLRRLGGALDAFSDYDLAAGADQLAAVADSPVVDAYPTATETAVDFLRNQRREDGTFGYWTDEAYLYRSRGHSEAEFREDLLEPTTAACRDALSAIDKSTQAVRE